jgi:hypothetical protein
MNRTEIKKTLKIQHKLLGELEPICKLSKYLNTDMNRKVVVFAEKNKIKRAISAQMLFAKLKHCQVA